MKNYFPEDNAKQRMLECLVSCYIHSMLIDEIGIKEATKTTIEKVTGKPIEEVIIIADI